MKEYDKAVAQLGQEAADRFVKMKAFGKVKAADNPAQMLEEL